MKKSLIALLLGSGLVLAACGGGSEEAKDSEPKTTDEETTDVSSVDADAVIQQNCIGCHGGDLTGGMGGMAPDITNSTDAASIEDVLKNGKGSMPAQGQLSDDEVKAVAEYLTSN